MASFCECGTETSDSIKWRISCIDLVLLVNIGCAS